MFKFERLKVWQKKTMKDNAYSDFTMDYGLWTMDYPQGGRDV